MKRHKLRGFLILLAQVSVAPLIWSESCQVSLQSVHAHSVLWEEAETMSFVLTVQTKKYGAITALDLLHEGRVVASLIKESTNLVDYSRKRIFQDLDTAIEFYLTQIGPDKNSWILSMGSLTAQTAFVVHHSTSSFPLP